MKKRHFQWGHSYHSQSYVEIGGLERGRVIPAYKTDNTVKDVLVHIWGPLATSEATESRTFTPDAETPQDALVKKAVAWVESRIAELDKEI